MSDSEKCPKCETRERNVHTEHCCVVHGCKYSDPECPVVSGKQNQSFPCELCSVDFGDTAEDMSLFAQIATLTAENTLLAGIVRETEELLTHLVLPCSCGQNHELSDDCEIDDLLEKIKAVNDGR